MRLAATCTALDRASVASWFAEVTWPLLIGNAAGAKSLAAWLQRHPGEAGGGAAARCLACLACLQLGAPALLMARSPALAAVRFHLVLRPDASVPHWNAAPLAAEVLCPLAAIATRSAASCLFALDIVPGRGSMQASVDAAELIRFSRLERLSGLQVHNLQGDFRHVFGLRRLTCLELGSPYMRGTCTGLRRLTGLQRLALRELRDADGGPLLGALSALRLLECSWAAERPMALAPPGRAQPAAGAVSWLRHRGSGAGGRAAAAAGPHAADSGD